MTFYGFANRATKRRFGHYVVVNGKDGKPLIYGTREEAERAMKDYARKVRANVSEYVICEVQV